mmetsp:Transcript_23217/g.48734  ORF Transcript_23217/g.48734 Transcript_23217/m.48734 type:complete len:115 (-) Transcript_23217:1277-1621(-)
MQAGQALFIAKTTAAIFHVTTSICVLHRFIQYESTGTFSLFLLSHHSCYLFITTYPPHICSILHFGIDFNLTIQWDAANSNHQSPVGKGIASMRGRRDNEKRSNCSPCKQRRSN